MNNAIQKLRVNRRDPNFERFEFKDENADKLVEAINAVLQTCEEEDCLPTDALLAVKLGLGSKELISRHRGDKIEYAAEDDEIKEILNQYKTICESYLVQGAVDGYYRERSSMFILETNYGYKTNNQIDLNHLNNQKVEILNDWQD